MNQKLNNKPDDKILSGISLDHEPESKDEKRTAAKIPQYEIDALARAFLPAILDFYQSEEGQREFAEWKVNREKEKLNKQLNGKN